MRPDMGEKQIIVVFRYDDYSNTTPTDLEINLLGLFQGHNVTCTFSVVPFAADTYPPGSHIDENHRLSEEKASILRNALDAGTVDVALHGCTHRAAFREGYLTEFRHVDYKIQEEKITRGKLCLEESLRTRITIFVPPWNSYDENTLQILEKEKFRVISSGTFGPAEEVSGLKFLPTTCDLTQVREAVEAARKSPEKQSIIIVLFHCYDFREFDETNGNLTNEGFAELLAWLASQRDVSMKSIDQAAEIIEDLGTRRFESAKTFLKSFELLPEFLAPAERLFYGSTDEVPNLMVRNRKTTAFFYLALFIMTSAAARLGAHFAMPQERNLLYVTLFLLVAVLISLSLYTLRNYLYRFNISDALNYRMARILCVLSGLCLGISISV